MSLIEAQYVVDRINQANPFLPANPIVHAETYADRVKLFVKPVDLVVKEDIHQTEQALSHVGKIVVKYLIKDYDIHYMELNNEMLPVDHIYPYKSPSEVTIDDCVLLDERVIESKFVMPEKKVTQEAYTYRQITDEYIIEKNRFNLYGDNIPEEDETPETIIDFYIWSYSTDGLLNPYPVYLQATVYADEIYGFIEHFDDLNPETRIEYIEQNEFFQPMHTNIDTGEATYGDWDKWDWLMDVKPYLVSPTDTSTEVPWNDTLLLDIHNLEYLDEIEGHDLMVDDLNYPYYNYMTWIPKLYYKAEVTDTERKVLFSRTKKSSLTDGFQPVGFMYTIDLDDPKEATGVYIPIFYHSSERSPHNDKGKTPSTNETLASLNSLSQDLRLRSPAFGGAILNLLRDVEYMLFKSTNVTYHAGEGQSAETTIPVNAINPNVKDSPVPGFYGTNAAKKEPNCMFYSYVLGSYLLGLMDPHTILYDGNYLTNYPDVVYFTHFPLNDIENSLAEVPISGTASSTSIWYPKSFVPNSDISAGCFPVSKNEGTISTGLCDGLLTGGINTTNTYIAIRLGWHGITAGTYGPGYLNLTTCNSQTVSNTLWGYALMMPSGYLPREPLPLLENDD